MACVLPRAEKLSKVVSDPTFRPKVVSDPTFIRLWLVAIAVLALTSTPLEARRALAEPIGEIGAAELPREARETLARIAHGGPFPFERDGVVFSNRERLLPARPRSYYHEYTVPTPNARDRGARRIVCGADVATLAECYYSNDHYRSFTRIRP